MSRDDAHPPELQRARFGAGAKADRFIGFWLELAIEGRQSKLRIDPRRLRRIVETFFSDQAVRAAMSAVGADAVAAELRDAASTYFQSCISDPSYSSLVWGMNRLSPEQLRGKAARDAVDVLRVVATAGMEGQAVDLPAAWIGGFADVFGAPGVADLRAVLGKRPELASIASLLSD